MNTYFGVCWVENLIVIFFEKKILLTAAWRIGKKKKIIVFVESKKITIGKKSKRGRIYFRVIVIYVPPGLIQLNVQWV